MLGLGIYGDSSDSGSGSEYEDTRSRTPDSKRRDRSEDFTDGQLQVIHHYFKQKIIDHIEM